VQRFVPAGKGFGPSQSLRSASVPPGAHPLTLTSPWPEKVPCCSPRAAFPDPTVADAILHRLVHSAYKITLRGIPCTRPQVPCTKATTLVVDKCWRRFAPADGRKSSKPLVAIARNHWSILSESAVLVRPRREETCSRSCHA